MENAKWNKIFLRPFNDEEKEYYGDKYGTAWDGKLPEVDEEVLVYTPSYKEIYTDIWIEIEDGVCFENTDEPVVYWMSFPEPPKIKE